jgi:hypothetical protein
MGARRLNDADIEKAVRLLDAWSDKLTWDRFLAVLATEVGHLYTKPGLRKHGRLVNAWEMAQARLRDSTKRSGARGNGDAAIAHACNRIASLEAENARIEQENRDLLERFVRWSYNATIHGLAPEQLDREIPIPPTKSERAARARSTR